MEKEIRRGEYMHFKGKRYYVLDVAKHSETGEELVLYHAYDDSTLWARPKRMFLEDVVVEGKNVPRFKFVEKD